MKPELTELRNLLKSNQPDISEAEMLDAEFNLTGFMQTLIEIDKSLKTKNKGNENVDNRNTNIIS